MTHFGPYLEKRERIEAKIKELKSPLDEIVDTSQLKYEPKKEVPSVKDMIGTSLQFISAYKQLNSKEQVVALINDVRKL